MAAQLGSELTAKVVAQITGTAGMNSALAALSTSPAPAPALAASQVRAQNIAMDLAERSGTVVYPSLLVYCEKLTNSLQEKFRSFSGKAQMAVEVRHSQDRIDGLQNALELYVDAAAQTISAARGDWGNGMFYAGAYQVAYGPIKPGGRNFIQTAKITFEVEVSRS